MKGLSPRVRGNPTDLVVQGRMVRSIPARAGEPPNRGGPDQHPGLYPRACGGTTLAYANLTRATGLSPRVRGNRLRQQDSVVRPVYPRACGGTLPRCRPRLRGVGLSPRVRGNLVRGIAQGPPERSIPARAGEPHHQRLYLGRQQVYPRACGGTRSTSNDTRPEQGLSPRVRGNRVTSIGHAVPDGSIPARAGEPRLKSADRPIRRVYPRACGGTRRPRCR